MQKCRYNISFLSSFIFILIYICTGVLFCGVSFGAGSFTDGVLGDPITDYSIEHRINAALYDTNQYSGGGEGTILTSDGGEVNDWEYNQTKYLQVNIMVVAKQDEVHVVEIKLPTPFYSVSDVAELPAGFSRVEMAKNDDLSTNDGKGTYYVNAGSGTIRYYLKPNMTRATIRLEIGYDRQLWDKLGHSPLTPEGVAPIAVSLEHEQSIDDVLAGYSSKVYLAKATSGARVMSTGKNYLKRNWNTTYWDGMDEYFGYMADPVRLWLFSTEMNREYLLKYYKRVTIDIDVPYYERDNVKYYLEYDKDNIVFEGTLNGHVKGTVTEATESHLSFYLDGYYAYDDKGIDVDFRWPSDLTTDEKQLDFTGGRTTFKVISNADTEVVGFSHPIGKITLATKQYEEIYVHEDVQTVTNKSMPNNSVTKLGNVFLRNSGTAASTEKNIKIEFNKKHLVTNMNLPADTKTRAFVVKYTLKNEEGNSVTLSGRSSWSVIINNGNYNKNIIDNMYVSLKRSILPIGHRKYYFDTISYTIKTINKRVNLHKDGDDRFGETCAGYFYGKLASTAEVGENLNGTFTITSPKDSGIDPYVYNYKSKVVETESSCYGLKNTKFSKSRMKAGDVVYTTGSIWVSPRFYHSDSTWLHNIRLALLLPNGVSVDRSSIDIRTIVGDKAVDVVGFTKKAVDNNNTLWIMDLNKDVYIGYFSEGLGSLPTNGDRLNYSIKLITDSDMEASTLYTDKMTFVLGMGQNNVIDVCYKRYKTRDVLDINEDGNTNDYIGCVSVNERDKCSIAANPISLEIKDKISVDGEGTVTNNDASIINKGDVISYELNIASRNDGIASSFEYYIPIIKKTAVSDDFLITSSIDTAFNLQLLEEAYTIGNDIYVIEYTTKEGVSYSRARTMSESEWYTAEELTQSGMDFMDVTLIRITVAGGGVIEKGMETTIGVKMVYQGDNIYESAGKYNAWRGCGYYNYDDGSKFVSGHFPAGGVTATVSVTESPINNILISTGKSIETGRMFYVYDIIEYNQSIMSEQVEFVVERNHDSDIVTLAISKSKEYMDTGSYLDKELIKIYDENGYEVQAMQGNLYRIKANRKYKIAISSLVLSEEKEAREYLYMHSYYAPLSAAERLVLARASAFIQS